MHIKTLTAQNFRCFENLQIDFQPGFNLLIGNNMSGKTAVLDALRVCIYRYVNQLYSDEIELQKKDTRMIRYCSGDSIDMVKQYPVRIQCEVIFDGSLGAKLSGTPVSTLPGSILNTCGQSMKIGNDGEQLSQIGDIEFSGQRVRGGLTVGDIEPPIVSFYGTNRNNLPVGDSEELRQIIPKTFTRQYGYAHCLSYLSSLPMIRSWIERRTMSEMQRKQRGLPLLEEGPLLGIERAVKICLPELKQFYFDFEFQELTAVFQDDRRLPWMMLSDGMRSLISLAMDIAWRAVVLNPQLGANAPELATGIVMIDELDLALHPTWQRRIVGDLSRAFPNLQFIATTHSPQIIGSAKNALVQKIDGDKVQTVAHPFGLDSNTLLTEVMGAKERDPAIVKLFDEVTALMNDKRWDEARAALARVTDQIDSLDTEVVSLRARIDFLSRAVTRS